MEYKVILENRRRIDYLYSVIIRTYNEAMSLPSLLESLKSKTDSVNVELIFIDSMSTDGTIELIKRKIKMDCVIIQIEKADFNFGLTCDLGITLSKARFCFLLSAHAIVDNESLNLCSAIDIIKKNSNIAGVYFRQIPNNRVGYSLVEEASLKHSFKKVGFEVSAGQKFVTFSNAASLINRDIWQIHQFGDKEASEDSIWASMLCKIGYTIVYFPSIIIQHSHNEDVNEFYRRLYINYKQLYLDGFTLKSPLSTFFKYFIGPIFVSHHITFRHYTYAKAAWKAAKSIKILKKQRIKLK
jgi:glycosyltransferase involved in cell wall biosynthesis